MYILIIENSIFLEYPLEIMQVGMCEFVCTRDTWKNFEQYNFEQEFISICFYLVFIDLNRYYILELIKSEMDITRGIDNP